MPKPPKRLSAGKRPSAGDASRASRGRGDADRSRGGQGNQASKRGSFRKREQEVPEHRGEPGKAQRFRDHDKRMTGGAPRERATRIKADLFGFHAVREAWRNPGRFVHALYLTSNAAREFEADLKKTTAPRPAPIIVEKETLDKAFPPGTVHQGIALACQPLAEMSAVDLAIAAEPREKSVILILDQVTDPHNIGAILRSACAFGASGVVMQSRHAPELTGILAKTACGALEHIPVAYETNLARAIETLKEHHYMVVGLDEHAEKNFGDLYDHPRIVLVLGAEGTGMRRLIKESCDELVTLPTRPPIASLNVSNAAAVALYALLS